MAKGTVSSSVPDRVLKFEEVKELLNMDKAVVLKLMREGHIKSFRYGKEIRSSALHVSAFINNCCNGFIIPGIIDSDN